MWGIPFKQLHWGISEQGEEDDEYGDWVSLLKELNGDKPINLTDRWPTKISQVKRFHPRLMVSDNAKSYV